MFFIVLMCIRLEFYKCTVINKWHVIKSTYPLDKHGPIINSSGIMIHKKRNIFHLVQLAE